MVCGLTVSDCKRLPPNPMSAGSPQENGFSEKAVGDCTRLVRAFMLGAPHLSKNKWGAAELHAGKVKLILPQPSRGNRTPYEIIHAGRKPDIDRLFIKVFGCPVQYQPLDKPFTKMTERTLDGYFLGLDYPSVLV